MKIVFKALGIFIIEANTLRNLSKTKTQPLEKMELIEQLRIQEIGVPLNTLQVHKSLESVNTAEDLTKVNKYLGINQKPKIILNEILMYEKE